MHVSSLSVLLARMHFLSRLGERCFALFSPSLHTASVRYNNQLYFNLVAIQPTEDPYHDFVVSLSHQSCCSLSVCHCLLSPLLHLSFLFFQSYINIYTFFSVTACLPKVYLHFYQIKLSLFHTLTTFETPADFTEIHSFIVRVKINQDLFSF